MGYWGEKGKMCIHKVINHVRNSDISKKRKIKYSLIELKMLMFALSTFVIFF